MNAFHRPLAAALALAACAMPLHAADLTVDIAGVQAQQGTIMVAVVDSAAGWDGQAKAVRGDGVAPDGGSVRLVFEGLPPGEYAVMVRHDENDNGDLDANFLGMPTEPYGFSNNPRVMRKPTWEEARFELGEDDLAIDIALR